MSTPGVGGTAVDGDIPEGHQDIFQRQGRTWGVDYEAYHGWYLHQHPKLNENPYEQLRNDLNVAGQNEEHQVTLTKQNLWQEPAQIEREERDLRRSLSDWKADERCGRPEVSQEGWQVY
jgi:hypothetical protein